MTLTVLVVSVCAFSLLQSLVMPVLATFQAEFDTTRSTATWVATSYLLSASVCTPLLGRAGDAYGKPRMMVLALLVLSVGSLGAALAPDIGWLIVARVVQGGGGAVMSLSFGIIRDQYHESTEP